MLLLTGLVDWVQWLVARVQRGTRRLFERVGLARAHTTPALSAPAGPVAVTAAVASAGGAGSTVVAFVVAGMTAATYQTLAPPALRPWDPSPPIPRKHEVFENDQNVLARPEFNGDARDTSGSARHARRLGGAFVSSAWGQGLRLSGEGPAGIDWRD